MGEEGGFKSIVKVLFAGLLWTALILYSEEFMHTSSWKANGTVMAGRVALYSLLLIM